MHFYKILTLIIIYFLLNNQLVFAERKYHRVRCRDVFCSDASKSNRKNLIKLANERRGYKEPREPWNLRLRYLFSQNTKNNRNLNNTSIYIIWKKIGIGQSNLKYKQITNNNALYDMSNSSLDISYTFGSNWTFTIGKGVVYKGMGSISFFDNNKVETEKVKGDSSFGIIGFEIGLIELLIGLRENQIKYTEFKSTLDENIQPGIDYNIKGKQWFFGGGISF